MLCSTRTFFKGLLGAVGLGLVLSGTATAQKQDPKPNDPNKLNRNVDRDPQGSSDLSLSNTKEADFNRPNPNPTFNSAGPKPPMNGSQPGLYAQGLSPASPANGFKANPPINNGSNGVNQQGGILPHINTNATYYNPNPVYGQPAVGIPAGPNAFGANGFGTGGYGANGYGTNGYGKGGYGLSVVWPNPVNNYGSNAYPGSYPSKNEIMVYQDGEFKVIENSNDPALIKEARVGFEMLQEAMKVLRTESRSESERADAQTVVKNYLEAHFEHDQKKRRDQVASLEAQVRKLRAQLEKRADSKDQLIELRIKLLENDASGLAFPQSWSQLPGMDAPLPNMENNYPKLNGVSERLPELNDSGRND